MSQGELLGTSSATVEHWRAGTPQEEIYLIAGPFTRYTGSAENVMAMVLLRTADAALAQQVMEGIVEPAEIVGVEDNAGIVTVAPFDRHSVQQGWFR